MFLLQSGFSVHRGGCARPAQPGACEEPGLGGDPVYKTWLLAAK